MSSVVEINAVKVSASFDGTLSRLEKKQAGKALLGIIRAAVCVHQGEITQQFLLGNEYHKRLRTAVSNGDMAQISGALQKLNRLHLDALRNAWKDSVKYLTDYYLSTHKSPIPPRLCIKVTTLPSDAGSSNVSERHIIDLLREDGNRSSAQVPISENTGFAEVAAKGTYFLENNIPEAVVRRQYKNARLNSRFATAFKVPSRLSPRYYNKRDDAEWMRCWDVGAKAPPPVRSCYKSTLIVPMTLTGNSLSEEFLEDTPVGKAAKVDRSIYGFLCFDHPNREYFHETDIHVGYIFADLLSIYRITSDALISKSVLYDEAKKIHKG